MQVKIIGPGLVVNKVTAVVQKALRDAGYLVTMPEFPGQCTYHGPEEWPDKVLEDLKHVQIGDPVHVDVKPMPWGA
jgi:hypothetical protein